MGKYKQKKRDRRSNPTSLLSMEECQAMEEEDAVHSHPVSGTVTSLVEKVGIFMSDTFIRQYYPS